MLHVIQSQIIHPQGGYKVKHICALIEHWKIVNINIVKLYEISTEYLSLSIVIRDKLILS